MLFSKKVLLNVTTNIIKKKQPSVSLYLRHIFFSFSNLFQSNEVLSCHHGEKYLALLQKPYLGVPYVIFICNISPTDFTSTSTTGHN